MNELVRSSLWLQLGAAINMLENAIVACPPEVWGTRRSSRTEFWYLVYHTLYWLNSDLAAPDPVDPPAPFQRAKPERIVTGSGKLLRVTT
jgi:hypothetical protein